MRRCTKTEHGGYFGDKSIIADVKMIQKILETHMVK